MVKRYRLRYRLLPLTLFPPHEGTQNRKQDHAAYKQISKPTTTAVSRWT